MGDVLSSNERSIMKNIIIVWILFILSGFLSTASFGMQHEQEKVRRVTNGLACEWCQREFKRTEHRVEHIISAHYTCPWCINLCSINRGLWRGLTAYDRQQRVDHIKKCAQKKKTSLWQCQKCSALSHYAKKDHKCGVAYQVNLVNNQVLSTELALKINQENTCNICSKPKTFVHARACRNHMMRKHLICPWCSTQFAQDDISYQKLSLQDRQAVCAHLIECAQANNQSLFACDSCFGVVLCSRTAHVAISCSGVVYKASERIKINGDTLELDELPLSVAEPSSEELLLSFQELGSKVQESNLLNQFSDQQEVQNSDFVVHQADQERADEEPAIQAQYSFSDEGSSLDAFLKNDFLDHNGHIEFVHDSENHQSLLSDFLTKNYSF